MIDLVIVVDIIIFSFITLITKEEPFGVFFLFMACLHAFAYIYIQIKKNIN